MRIHCIKHVPFEGPARIEEWALEKGHDFAVTEIFRTETWPEQHMFDWLVVMGGPMGVYDEAEYSWLSQEKKFLDASIKADKVILGVCFGAQILAHCMGAEVRKNIVKEIGWYPVSLTPPGWDSPIFGKMPATFEAFHWHSDMFEIPRGAVHIASSHACPNQAFAYENRIFGLQFHLESTPESIEILVKNCGNELEEEGDHIQDPDFILNPDRGFDQIKTNLHILMDAIAEHSGPR
ncbi:MAG TPA: type 1 glutamine amidotransferase [Thermodesulfobacteriaceae bacterium]|nr:type 1 glutamine amidotransferase [Thermodesulfobacteriaceae bacterium]